MRLFRCIVVGALAVFGWSGVCEVMYGDTILTTSTDPSYGIYNTTAGGDSTAAVGNSTAQPGTYNTGESAASAIDGSELTKYCIYNTSHSVVGTGLYVTPSGGKSVVSSIRFATANDASGRDPSTITLEGSNALADNLTQGASWTLIYSGNAGLDADPGRQTWGSPIAISSDEAFTSYRLLITSVRDAVGGSYLTQFSEVRLSGTFVPEPGTTGILISGALSLLAFAWRRQK
jgi:hypothetical protein